MACVVNDMVASWMFYTTGPSNACKSDFCKNGSLSLKWRPKVGLHIGAAYIQVHGLRGRGLHMRVARFKVHVKVCESRSSLTSWIQKEFCSSSFATTLLPGFLTLCGRTHEISGKLNLSNFLVWISLVRPIAPMKGCQLYNLAMDLALITCL